MRWKRNKNYWRMTNNGIKLYGWWILNINNINFNNITISELMALYENSILRKLKKGDKINTRIINITPNEVELLLADGTSFNARLEERITAYIGDEAEFLVTDKNDDRISLKFIKDDESDDNKNAFDMRV